LETVLPLGLQLVREGVLSESQLIAALTCKPGDVLGIERNTGWLLIDPLVSWTVSGETLLSTGKNTPWLGQTLQGLVRRVFN
jgi:dihydroorotase